MDLDKIKKLIELAKDQGLSELKIEIGNEKYSVKLPEERGDTIPSQIIASPLLSSPGPQEKIAVKSDDGLKEVTSPFVGTFYRSSSPDMDPYIKVGDNIGHGKVLCIIEAMKIMNEIESEIGGEIVEICVENETYVEFGQVLFRVRV